MRVTRYVGQDVSVRMSTLLTDGTPANPTSVVFRVRSPQNVVTVYTLGTSPNVSQLTVGQLYQCIVDLATAGVWRIRGEAILNGDVVGVSETEIPVKASIVS